MAIPLIAQILIMVAIMIISYALMPKPKMPKPEAAKEMEGPTSEAGKEIPVIFGTLIVKGPNCLWSGDKSHRSYKVKG